MLANTGGSGGGGHTAAKTSHAHAQSYAAAPHPATVALQEAVSHMAVQHAANVVRHMQATHAHGHNPAPQGYHHMGTGFVPTIRNAIEHQAQPINELSLPLAKAIHMAMQDPSNYAANPGYSMVQGGPGQMPWQVRDPRAQYQAIMQGQQQGPNYAGNNSIANPNQGADGGIMGLLQSLFGG